MNEKEYPADLRPAVLPRGNWIIENGYWVLKGVVKIPVVVLTGAWKLIQIGEEVFWKLDPNQKRPDKSPPSGS